ncbi:molybdenum ABC transporter ATP-binding protein [Pseudomonas aeruginosa]|nr:molybdenum ABC transporter ATP-binding protein [Pseudomonas aeruginosa]
MDGLRLRFRRAYPGFELDIDLALPGRGVTALFGHSGSGKSTCLRCIAGLEKAAEGEVTINGETWQDSRHNLFVAPHRRALGYVFQDANLFRHLTVRRNLAFGLKRIAAAERRVELEQACALLGIEHLLERMPERLSGGEQQRVGIARALLTSPRLLLMDEPLASLDLKRKGEILPYLERLHEELDIPVLYVSHSPDEVARLADHLVLLENGKVRASGPLTLVLPGSALQMRVAHAPLAPGKRLRFKVQARDVSLNLRDDAQSSILNRLPVRVLELVDTDTAAHVLVRLDAGGNPLLARITRYSRDQLQLRPGQLLWAQIKSVAVLA